MRIQSGGLHIQHDVSHTVEIDVLASLHDFSAVVDHIALAARNQLDADILGRSKSFRKCLHSAVIGNGDGSVSPLCRLVNQIRGSCAGIPHGKARMQMQFYTFFRSDVLSGRIAGLQNIEVHLLCLLYHCHTADAALRFSAIL